MTRTQKILLTLFSIICIVYFSSAYFNKQDIKLPEKSPANSFVVLELFTSQGCSSCPAADDHIRKIKKMTKQKNLRIYSLAFHVDYWDHLGWKDCFSNQTYSARQYQYARVFSKRNIYTPQMVLNGSYEFVGSDESECQRLISNTLQKENFENIDVKGSYSIINEKLEITYEIGQSFNGYVNIALVQNEAKVKINRGENSGRVIEYANIVRVFKQMDCPAGNKEHLQIERPQDLSETNLTVFIYLQNKIDMKIVGVTKAGFI